MSAAPKLTKPATHPTNKKVKDEKFYRDGAKYVCRQCKKNFFTRNEVEACFDTHPVEQKTS